MMRIHLGGTEGQLQTIELSHINRHMALPHLNHLITYKKPEHFKTIHKIQIDHSLLNNEDFHALANIIKHCTELHDLQLQSNHIDTNHAHELLCSLPANSINCLSFTDNWIGEQISDDFFAFMENQQHMKILDFSLNWLRDTGIVKLVQALYPNLEHLHLSYNDFHSEGMLAISQFVANCPSLTKLDVSFNHLDASSAKYLGEVIKGEVSVSNIKANSNQLGDAGACIIADALVEQPLPIKLDLSDNGITSSGAKLIVDSAAADDRECSLDLRHNPLDKAELGQWIKAKQEVNPLLKVMF